jgi:hypothetical protein
MQKTERPGHHERFKELCALARANELSVNEQLDLQSHLQTCDSCQEIYDQYCVIGDEGMRCLSGEYALTEEAARWDSREVRKKLLDAVRKETPEKVVAIRTASPQPGRYRAQWGSARRLVWPALAACAIIAVALGAYRVGELKAGVARHASASVTLPAARPAASVQSPIKLIPSQATQISQLEQILSTQRSEVERLNAALKLSEQRVNELVSVSEEKETDLRQFLEERDKLAVQLASSQDANRTIQASLASLRADHDQALSHASSLEGKVAELTVAANVQGRRLKDDEQYLSSDRDIRELMGARKLYIADVFDVDSVSRTRKPFGRVFYTQNKSLVFYAFDLDHQPGVKNASTFQVWGQKDSELNAESHPMNLGILYEDSESNRRWVLRTDDSKRLAEIDAVFVTVEPHGGSEKPTGKPFLYALLRKEANHP